MNVATPFVRMSLNLDNHFEKLLNFKFGGVVRQSIISSLPQELVTLIIKLVLNGTNQNPSQNNLDAELEVFCVLPKIKEQLRQKNIEYSARLSRYPGKLSKFDEHFIQFGQHWFKTPIGCK
eukprot:TRINITY_DN1052_c0_g2_i18.p2 TRINITY_DN1052_c0_g2~~TRINITY_DN1052_c0_g2_i18.p2  ORF type:complete len:121 (+),score=23.50 TRINITY_DN1052_c0_g2_i18:460-822(+)